MLWLRVPLLPSDRVLRQRRPPGQHSGGLREQVRTYLYFNFILDDIRNVHLFVVKSREFRQQTRHKEDESLFQLGLHDAGKLTHGIWRTFDKVRLGIYEAFKYILKVLMSDITCTFS